jgi:HSP20 family molecular chaperone IbpA
MENEKSSGKMTENRAELESTRSGPHLVPDVDIFEAEENLVLLMDMPGVALDEVEISLERGVLSVFGRARSRKLDEGFTLLASEYRSGHYQRAFSISEEADVEGIEATMKNGVLRLVVPRSAKARARKIKVRSA